MWATPYESPVHRDFHGRAIHLETEMRSPVSSWDPNDPDYIEYYMDHDDDYDPDYYPDGSPVLGRSYMADATISFQEVQQEIKKTNYELQPKANRYLL